MRIDKLSSRLSYSNESTYLGSGGILVLVDYYGIPEIEQAYFKGPTE